MSPDRRSPPRREHSRASSPSSWRPGRTASTRTWRIGIETAGRRGARWCLLCNGLDLRIVSASRLYSRRFTAFDLAAAAERHDTAALLWQLASTVALCGDVSDDRSLDALVAASDRFSAGVCRSLRHGVLAASADVLSALLARDRERHQASVDRAFEQALTIVYRMLFLLFAEARSLVPIWHAVYRESYSIESIRDLAERSGRVPGLWDALRAIARLAHAGCRAGDLLVRPFNGRLFSPARTPLAERRDLDDRLAQRAVLAVSTRPTHDRAGRERIVYRDLGVEELGGVYETLLDYQPGIGPMPAPGGAPGMPIVQLEAGSGVRKATGTFYTPLPIAEYLVRRHIGPPRAERVRRRDSRAAHPRHVDGQRRVSGGRVSLPLRRLRTRDRHVGRISAERHRRQSARVIQTADRGAMPVRRRRQPDGRAARSIVAVALHAVGGPASLVSRPSARHGGQPAGNVADAPASAAAHATTQPAGFSSALRRPDRRRRASGCAADPLFARDDAQRHARTGACQGAGVLGARRRPQSAALEARRQLVVFGVVRERRADGDVAAVSRARRRCARRLPDARP